MAQKLKPELEARILASAEATFAEDGYTAATMAAVAARAQVSTGNLYRYFDSKELLFDAVVDEDFRAAFMELVKRRVRALARSESLTALDPKAQAEAEQLLSFWIAHRLKVVTLLGRAAGSRHAGFAVEFVETLTKLTLRDLAEKRGERGLTRSERFVVRTLFDNTLRALVAILSTFEDEAEIRHAFACFWSYQLAGLAGLSQWVQT